MNNVFRDKSMKNIQTPEQFNEYVRISKTVSWGVLIAVCIFIIGVLVWAVNGRMNTVADVGVYVSDGELVGYVSEEKMEQTAVGSEIYVDDKKYQVSYISSEPKKLPRAVSEYIQHIGNLESECWVYEIYAKCDLPDGIYRASLVTESIRPIELILD